MVHNILSKLFKTWIIIVGSIGIIGFSWFTVVTIHDSYIAHKVLQKAKETFPKINPSGNTYEQLSIIKESMLIFDVHTTEELFIVGCYNGAMSLYEKPKFDPNKPYEESDKVESPLSKKVTTSCRKAFLKVDIKPQDDTIAFGCGFGIGAILKDLNRTKEANYWLSKNSKICIQLSNWDLQELTFQSIKEFKARTNLEITQYNIYIKDRWGDSDMSNISYMWMISLWLIMSIIIIGISYGLQKWLIWLTENKQNEQSN